MSKNCLPDIALAVSYCCSTLAEKDSKSVQRLRQLRRQSKTGLSNLIIIPLSNEAISMLSHNKTLKTKEEMALNIFLLCQVWVGTVANFFLFIHNFTVVLIKCQLTPIQVLVTNLAVASAFNLLLLAIPNSSTVFLPRKAPSDLSCKLWCFICLVA
jgi:vomeronasal1 receptor